MFQSTSAQNTGDIRGKKKRPELGAALLWIVFEKRGSFVGWLSAWK